MFHTTFNVTWSIKRSYVDHLWWVPVKFPIILWLNSKCLYRYNMLKTNRTLPDYLTGWSWHRNGIVCFARELTDMTDMTLSEFSALTIAILIEYGIVYGMWCFHTCNALFLRGLDRLHWIPNMQGHKQTPTKSARISRALGLLKSLLHKLMCSGRVRTWRKKLPKDLRFHL